MNFQELYSDFNNKILIDILKNSLEDYCINTVIFAKTLDAEEFSDVIAHAYDNIKLICLSFNIWNYVKVHMNEYRDFIWDKYNNKYINNKTKEDDAVVNFILFEMFDYFWDKIWQYWETGGDQYDTIVNKTA